jgi:hypothetical protein
MTGINYYPLRVQDKTQRIITASSNIAIESGDVSSAYYCTNSSAIYISITGAISNALPVGSQFDFIRANSNVAFSAAPGGVTITSASGATPQIRVTGGACTFLKTTSNTWVVIGDITT